MRKNSKAITKKASEKETESSHKLQPISKVFYAGCFDPFTNGHLDVVKQAIERFGQVIIGLGINEKKTRSFDRDQMIIAINKTLIQENIQDKVLCIAYDRYTGETALGMNCTCLIRGIKNKEEFEYEKYLFRYNLEHYNLNTVFFMPSRKELEPVSSTLAKELYNTGNKETLKSILPKPVFDYVWNPKRLIIL